MVQAAAYMAARMPACYAAVFTVLQELRVRLPAFQPVSLLDFGAGPGTAIWAAQQVSSRRCSVPGDARHECQLPFTVLNLVLAGLGPSSRRPGSRAFHGHGGPGTAD